MVGSFRAAMPATNCGLRPNNGDESTNHPVYARGSSSRIGRAAGLANLDVNTHTSRGSKNMEPTRAREALNHVTLTRDAAALAVATSTLAVPSRPASSSSHTTR